MPPLNSESAKSTESEEAAVIVPLQKPIPNMEGALINEISFREPTAGDILRHGNPVRYDPRFDPPKIEFNEKSAFDMMYALSGVPVACLSRMAPNDAVTAMWAIARFFIPGLQTKQPKPPAQPVS